MDMRIGERIRKRRNELHITQLQIKNETGISSGNLSGIEAGRSLPSASALISLSKILNCTTDWILMGDSSKSENILLSITEETLLNNFRKLPELEKEEFIGILDLKLHKIQKENVLI